MANATVVCQTAYILSQYGLLKVILAIKMAICFSGILLTSVHSFKQGIAWLAHSNAKALYCFHIFWAVYLPATYSIAFTTDFIRFLSASSDPCFYTISTIWGISLRTAPVIGLVSQSFTMLSFSIERLIATVIPVKYEKIRSSNLGIGMGIISFFLALLIVYRLILEPIRWNFILPMTAVRTEENASSYQIFLSVLIYLETTTILTFSLSLLINYGFIRRPTSRTPSLATKYQINENKHLISTLLPCFAVHFVLNLLPMLALKAYLLFIHYEQGAYAAWAELWTQAQMYSLVMPLLIHLRLKLRRSKEITNIHNAATHFQQLHSIFNKSP